MTEKISIHALREEGDFCTFWMLCRSVSDFYPRPPRGGRLGNYLHALEVRAISIHALREEGDGYSWNREYGWIQFLSTPSARRATRVCAARHDCLLFLSTPSARRATGFS